MLTKQDKKSKKDLKVEPDFLGMVRIRVPLVDGSSVIKFFLNI